MESVDPLHFAWKGGLLGNNSFLLLGWNSPCVFSGRHWCYTWLDKGATVDSSGCWTKGGKYVAPESLLPYLAQQIHSLGHSGPATMNHRFSNQWWNPKFRNAATETVKRCVTCQKIMMYQQPLHPAHTPAPPGPFRHLQVDYISLPLPLVKEKLTFW